MAKLNVLIVEDEFLVGADIEESLIALGYEVQNCVSSGLAAIEEVKRNLPDVILMDIRLKGEMTGIEAAKLIQEKHDVPIIYLTANADIKTIEQAKTSLPYGYIIKPYSEKDLQTNIEIARFKFENDIQNKIESDQYNALFRKSDNQEDQLFFDSEDGIGKINVHDIYYIEETDNKCKVIQRNNHVIVPKELSHFEKRLPEDRFIKINNHCIVNVKKIFLAKFPEIIIADIMVVLTVDDEIIDRVNDMIKK